MTGKKRSASSSRWLQEHFSDKYVQQAQKKGLRSRAWFKLDEIQQSDKIFKPGMTVVDPCDALEIEQAVPAIAAHKGPVYMRLLRGKVPLVIADGRTFVDGNEIYQVSSMRVGLFKNLED